MNLSKNGIELIKTFEGCRLKAYKCPAGVWTIGYGHTNNVRPDDVITQEEAEELLKRDLKVHEDNVKRLVKSPLTQGQFNALVSFEYNIGYGAFANSTLLKLLNAQNYEAASKQFSRWVYVGDKVSEGLVKRRIAETEMFLS